MYILMKFMDMNHILIVKYIYNFSLSLLVVYLYIILLNIFLKILNI